jgi:pyrimidine operon attenuation protein / uracil phosphoribosyltransferase
MDQRSDRILTADEIDAAIFRLAGEVAGSWPAERLGIVGVHTFGVPLAKRICHALRARHGVECDVGTLDINLYRDDLDSVANQPLVRSSDIPFEIDGSRIVLVDDVLFTGRTVRAALSCICELGRPSTVQLVVLIDRGYRELPIKADFIGKSIPTTRSDVVKVRVASTFDPADEVLLVRDVTNGSRA